MFFPPRLQRIAFLCASSLCCAGLARAQVAETNGVVRIEAEAFDGNTARTIGGVDYAWTTDSATPGYAGAGYLEARPGDGTSATTVAASWETLSPRVDYSVTFANPGTYYVWVRGYAGDAASAGLYVGLNGASPVDARIDLQQFNAWSWSNTSAASATPVALTVPAAGTYTLNIWMRDAWLDLDRILLTRNPNFLPVHDANFWRNQNIYQIITDRFCNGDTANDVAGLPNFSASNGSQAHGGDFKGIEQKLDYIKALGATAIWISPILKNANGDYHGYAATDFYAVNPRMGTLADLQRLVREAQKRGILVISDVVVNHAGSWIDSGDAGWPAFRYPPSGYNLRYNSGGQQYAAPFANTNLTAEFGNTDPANVFHNNGATANWSDVTQVECGELFALDDFKTETSYVRRKMGEIWAYWINAAGFDAFRLDTVKHVDMGFWDFWSPQMRAAAQAADKPNFFQFGEVFDGSDAKCGSYTGSKTSGVYKMESVLDYPLYYQMGSVFATATGATSAIESRYGNLSTNNYDTSALDSLVLNLDNHDNPRFLNATGSTAARLEMALVFLYTTRGIPSLYYGTEQDFNGGADPNNREDMFDGAFEQGPSLGDNFNMTHPRFKLVAKMNNLRRLYPALRTGSHHMLWVNWTAPGLLAYARRLGNEEVYVVMNTAATTQTIGARPTIHPAGTELVNIFDPTETYTVATGTDGIPAMNIPPSSFKMFVARNQLRNLQPVVDAVTPAHDSTGVSVASTIAVTFSRPMDTGSAESAFSTVPATTGSFLWASNNTVMTYTPSSNLAGNTSHAVRIENTATDTNGLAMHGAFESRFTTGAPSTLARPSINSASSADIAETTATLNATVTANGAATGVYFEYGTTSSFGNATAGRSIGSGNSPAAVSAGLSGLQANTGYYFRAVATNSQGTTTGNTLTFTTTTALPLATTTPASFVTARTANINGDVNPNGLDTSVYFEWANRSDILGNATAYQPVGNGTNLAARWTALSGLEPDSTYFFRIVAVNVDNGSTNKVYGATLSFKTLPVKPTVVTLGTTNVATTAATLQGTANPNGSATVFYFEYGTNPAYGSFTAAQDAGSGTNTVALAAPLNDLVPGQNYYYRAVASNAFGLSFGAGQSFAAGLPPPSAATLAPTSLTTSSAQLRGSVNPNDSYASAWFDYGTTTNYGSSTRATAADGAETYSNFNFSSPNNAGGIGFGNFSRFSAGTGAGTFLAITNPNQTIDGTKSFGAYAGSGTGISFRRTISATRQYGSMTVSARFNVDNSKGFSGFNLKSTAGSGSSGFGSGELVSFGISPVAGNTGILVTDSNGARVLDLGADVRNTILDFKVDFDARNRRYVVGAKFRTNSAFAKLGGTMSGTGTNVTHLGFANWNGSGAYQDLMFDTLQVLGSTAIGGGTNTLMVSNALSGLSANTLYHYRVATMNLDGGISYGQDASFYTGVDLAVTKTNSGGALVRKGTGQFIVTVWNAGATTSSGTVTVTEQPAAGMTVTSMSGTGWTFNSNNLTATRTTTVAAGASYPPITVNVTVAPDAPAILTNSVAVSGGGDGNSLNNTATAVASVTPGPDLAVGKSADGPLQQGGTGSFTLTVTNVGGSPSEGSVTVLEQPPQGMTVTSMSGAGWTIDTNALTATRTDAVAAGASYPPIAVQVAVAPDAPASLTNSVAVSGGGETDPSNNTAQAAVGIAATLTPIEAWRIAHFGTNAGTGVAADDYIATEDGLPNLMKYAFGLNPTNVARESDRPSLQSFPPLAIKFRRAKEAADVTIHVEATDAADGPWTNVWSSSTNEFAAGTNSAEEVTVQDPLPLVEATQRYLRVKVTRP